MMTSMLAAVIGYISTNIDDIFVIMILLSQCSRKGRQSLIAGHFLGVGLITAISMLGAFGLQNLPLKYVGLLGLVPIVLGIKSVREYRKGKDEDDELPGEDVGVLGMAMITLGNGADNIGVYIPLFTGFSLMERLGAVVIFAVMTAVWVHLANTLSEFPKVKALIRKYRHIAIPLVFFLLGLYIIMDSGLFG